MNYYKIAFLRISLIFLLMSSIIFSQSNTRISGFITDKESGEVLVGANVFLMETGKGMATDRNGYYVLDNIAPGDYTFIISYLGYEEYKEKINFVEDLIIKKDIETKIANNILKNFYLENNIIEIFVEDNNLIIN